MQNPFGSIAQLRSAFNAGLLKLARQDGLGPFILCCANATSDPALFPGLEVPLDLGAGRVAAAGAARGRVWLQRLQRLCLGESSVLSDVC